MVAAIAAYVGMRNFHLLWGFSWGTNVVPHPARNQARSVPGERLPVPSGWRFGKVRAHEWAGQHLAGIKYAAMPMQRHTTGRRAPSVAKALRPESSAQRVGRASARPDRLALW